jgi:hypothetical protein
MWLQSFGASHLAEDEDGVTAADGILAHEGGLEENLRVIARGLAGGGTVVVPPVASMLSASGVTLRACAWENAGVDDGREAKGGGKTTERGLRCGGKLIGDGGITGGGRRRSWASRRGYGS